MHELQIATVVAARGIIAAIGVIATTWAYAKLVAVIVIGGLVIVDLIF